MLCKAQNLTKSDHFGPHICMPRLFLSCIPILWREDIMYIFPKNISVFTFYDIWHVNWFLTWQALHCSFLISSLAWTVIWIGLSVPTRLRGFPESISLEISSYIWNWTFHHYLLFIGFFGQACEIYALFEEYLVLYPEICNSMKVSKHFSDWSLKLWKCNTKMHKSRPFYIQTWFPEKPISNKRPETLPETLNGWSLFLKWGIFSLLLVSKRVMLKGLNYVHIQTYRFINVECDQHLVYSEPGLEECRLCKFLLYLCLLVVFYSKDN